MLWPPCFWGGSDEVQEWLSLRDVAMFVSRPIIGLSRRLVVARGLITLTVSLSTECEPNTTMTPHILPLDPLGAKGSSRSIFVTWTRTHLDAPSCIFGTPCFCCDIGSWTSLNTAQNEIRVFYSDEKLFEKVNKGRFSNSIIIGVYDT